MVNEPKSYGYTCEFVYIYSVAMLGNEDSRVLVAIIRCWLLTSYNMSMGLIHSEGYIACTYG